MNTFPVSKTPTQVVSFSSALSSSAISPSLLFQIPTFSFTRFAKGACKGAAPRGGTERKSHAPQALYDWTRVAWARRMSVGGRRWGIRQWVWDRGRGEKEGGGGRR